MGINILLQIQEGQLRVFEEAIEAWKAEALKPRNGQREQAVMRRLLAGVVLNALPVPNAPRQLWETTLNLAGVDGIEDYQETGAGLRRSFDKALNILQAVLELVETFENAGQRVDGTDKLRNEMAGLIIMRDRFIETWPWPDESQPQVDPQVIQESLEAYRRGEFQDVEDILHELQAPHPEAN